MNPLIKRMLNACDSYLLFFGHRRSLQWGLLLVIGVCCVAGYMFLTYSILKKMSLYLGEEAELCAERIQRGVADDLNVPASRTAIAASIKNRDIPMVVTDTAWRPVVWNRKVSRDTCGDTAALRAVRAKSDELRDVCAPLPLCHAGSVAPIGYLVYGRSSAIRLFGALSFFMVATSVALIAFMYLSSRSRRHIERGNLWVALAKETAHQLGTPISALMGWVEYLRSAKDDESALSPADVISQIDRICDDMANDLWRLRKVSSRFSQIGSVPVLSPCDINEVLVECMDYFKIRLPLLRRKIELRQQFGKLPPVYGNRELLGWVFENLMKNAIDAIQRETGTIEIRTVYFDRERIVRVYHADNGKGITWEAHKNIFSPGYSTKTRGWGLGLTLAKRIVEDYHKGKIFVHWSKKDMGTVMCVDLPIDADGGEHRNTIM